MKFLPNWTSSRKSSLYRVVSASDEDCDSKEALLEENNVPRAPYKEPNRNKRFYVSLALNAALAVCVLVLSIPKLQRYLRDPFNNYSTPSPIVNKLHIPLRTEWRDGSLLPGNPPSLFRQEPSDAVDEAWNRLTNINPIPISAQDVRNIGYDPEIVARWPEEYGLGDDAYVARLDVFHEIHCLNMLRQEIHYDYYGWAKPHEASPDHRVPISHCIHALLQSLMCSANTDPFIHYWVDIGDEPYPDFSINRQCRDFETVWQWQEKNSIPMSQFRDVIRKPTGVAPRIMSLEYKYMVGLINQDPAVNLTAARLEEFEPISNGP